MWLLFSGTSNKGRIEEARLHVHSGGLCWGRTPPLPRLTRLVLVRTLHITAVTTAVTTAGVNMAVNTTMGATGGMGGRGMGGAITAKRGKRAATILTTLTAMTPQKKRWKFPKIDGERRSITF